MKINKKELLEKLDLVKNTAIGWKNILDVSNTFFFTGDYLVAYNDKTFFAIKIKTDFKCIVSAKEFYKIIYNIQQEKIKIEKEKEQLKITGKNIQIEINCLLVDISLIEKTMELIPQKWKKFPTNFYKGLSLNVFSTSKEITKPAFTCIHVKNDIIESSDNFRISKFIMNKTIKDELMLPFFSVAELLSLKIKLYLYAKSNGWLFLSDEDCFYVFGMRELCVDFPDTSSFFSLKGEKITLPEKFIDNVELVSVLASGDYDFDKRINIVIKDGYIYCKTQNQIGTIKTKFKTDNLQEINFEINPIFLKEILKNSLEFVYNNSYIMFISNNYKHVISLYQGNC